MLVVRPPLWKVLDISFSTPIIKVKCYGICRQGYSLRDGIDYILALAGIRMMGESWSGTWPETERCSLKSGCCTWSPCRLSQAWQCIVSPARRVGSLPGKQLSRRTAAQPGAQYWWDNGMRGWLGVEWWAWHALTWGSNFGPFGAWLLGKSLALFRIWFSWSINQSIRVSSNQIATLAAADINWPRFYTLANM